MIYTSNSEYASSPWLPRHCFSLYNARLSNCRTLSLDKPNMFPISDKDFCFPSSIPNLRRIILLSFGLKIFKRLRTCRLIICFPTLTSGISTAVSAVISCSNKNSLNHLCLKDMVHNVKKMHLTTRHCKSDI